MRRRSLIWGLMAALVLVLALTACGGNEPEVIHEEVGADQTLAAQTEIAMANPTATEGPAPTPLPTGTPYVIPTPLPEMDQDLVITRVGNEEITLGEYRKRVRMERFQPLWLLADRAERRGPKQVLDLTLQENVTTLSLFATLYTSRDFGREVQRIMIIDEIVLQEAARRRMDLDPYQYNNQLALFLGLTVGDQGELPDGWESRYEEFLQGLKTYADMSESEFERVVRARALYYQLQFLISQEPEALPEDSESISGMEVQDILLETEADAEAVITRLQAGEKIADIAADYGFTAAENADARLMGIGDQSVAPEVVEAVFAADPYTVVGPIETEQGWYVAYVLGAQYEALSPTEIQNYRQRHFLDWVEGRMDDPLLVEDFENWVEFTPDEPLPMDVSPLLTDEYVTMPEQSDPLGLNETEESSASE